MSAFRAEAHTMTRVHLDTAMPFDAFVTALEQAAPTFDPVPVQSIVERGGTWDDVLAEVAKNAPNELMRYGKIDATPLLGVAGHDTRAIEYLIGNHVIAECMFRHDPRALLYAPLRMLVYSKDDGHAIFTMDKPSDAFGSLGIPEVTEVGKGLDRKVANLLRVVGVDAGDAFT